MQSNMTRPGLIDWLFWIAIFITLSYITLSLGIAIGAIEYVSGTSTDTALKVFLDRHGLNLLGDTLSGLFAPLTFLIVVITSFLQNRQVKKNIAAMAEQNRLAKITAQAQYKFALHDKRLVVYKNLKSVATDLLKEGTIQKETLFKLIDCVDDAKFIYDGQILQWITNLFHRSSDLVRLNVRISNAQQKLKDIGLDDDEKDALNNLIDQEHEIEIWLFDEVSFTKIDEILTPALKLPDNIE